jgi:signal transduction histidine kinase
MRNSLIFKLMGSFLLLVLISALIISISTSMGTKNAFNQYSTSNRQMWTQRLAQSLSDYYSENKTWLGIETVLQAEFSDRNSRNGNQTGMGKNGMMGMPRSFSINGMMDSTGQRLIMVNGDSTVLFDSQNEITGSQLSASDIQSGTPITLDNQQIGTLLVTSDSIQAGTPAALFFDSVRHSIVASVATGVIIAIILGFILFNQFTSPLRQLKKAAAEVGKGNFKERVDIKSHDEFADVGLSFNQMAESLEKAEEGRLHYMADIAHELRTPLTAIQGTVEAMQDNILPLDDEQLAILHNQTTLLNRLVNDLRLLSLAETGHLKLDTTRINPAELVRQIVDGMKPLMAQKNINLEIDLQDHLPEWQLDADRFAQILNNLLSNAIRYTPENGTITVHVGYKPSKKILEINVTDTGIGISAEDIPHVFDRFYRADRSRARVSGGAGLGLAIVKRLVEAHGGQISVTSPVFSPAGLSAYGTRFTISLPE